MVLDTGAVTRGSGSKNEDKERNIRKWFVDRDLIEGVILMPDNLFYNTTAAGVIVVLNKRKPESKKGKITLVNASKRGPRTSNGRPTAASSFLICMLTADWDRCTSGAAPDKDPASTAATKHLSQSS